MQKQMYKQIDLNADNNLAILTDLVEYIDTNGDVDVLTDKSKDKLKATVVFFNNIL